MFGLATFVALLAAPAVLAHPIEHAHVEAGSLGARWYHEASHPVHRLFARQSNATNGTATPGSPAWVKQYPSASKLTAANLKPEWKDVLDKAVSSGLIPSNCPVSKQSGGGAPTYSNSSGTMNPEKQPICSSSAQCRGDDQVYDMPDGMVGISFDDGPLPPSPTLYDFLKQQNLKATHFYIGQNVLQYYQFAQQAFTNGDDLAVHTWTHPYMTTLSNEIVMAELAWTMQIISDISGGRIPKYWRPPYGDSDNRVRAIAKLLGLTTVIWNDDTNDWAITENPPTQTVSGATNVLKKAYAGPKTPGLCILEHELSTQSVNIFIDNFPLIAQNGWKASSIADILGKGYYQNSADDTSPVTTATVGQPVPTLAPSTSASSNSTGGNSNGGTNSGTSSGSTNSSSESSHSGALPSAALTGWLALAAMIPIKNYKFLRQNNVKATHFYLGQNILEHFLLFKEAFEVNGDDIAVHTWTHPYTTTLSNEDALGELAWTMQIIHDMTGGRVPRFRRPPYGDADNRARAIAREVLGLPVTTVIWNDDTRDWAITEGNQNAEAAMQALQQAYAGHKSPGLRILEHELSDQSVEAFVNTFLLIARNGLTTKSTPDALDLPYYQNSAGNTSPVITADIVQLAPTAPSSFTARSSNNISSSSFGSQL